MTHCPVRVRSAAPPHPPPRVGRQPGAHNKRSVRAAEDLEKTYPDFKVLCEMVELFRKTKDEMIKFNCLRELAQYLYPKLRATDHNININEKRVLIKRFDQSKDVDNVDVIDVYPEAVDSPAMSYACIVPDQNTNT